MADNKRIDDKAIEYVVDEAENDKENIDKFEGDDQHDGPVEDPKRRPPSNYVNYDKTITVALPRVEDHPWRSLSYIIFTIQFMSITIDLFMDTSVDLGWHYGITSVEFVLALLLTLYQGIRLMALRHRHGSTGTSGGSNKYKASFLLLLSLSMQLAMVALAAYSYAKNSDPAEWSMFGISIAWGVVNPMTYEAVEASNADTRNEESNRKKRLGPVQATVSVFTHHFSRYPFLFGFGTLFAVGQALLGTYQGAVINELTKAATKPATTSEDEVEDLAFTLVAVWFSVNVAHLVFDFLSAKLFTKLEVWMREEVFESSFRSKESQGDSPAALNTADYQARYASDISGVVSLYGSLLRGVIVNLLMICTNFAFLAIYEWRVATVTLGFLAMGVTSGPTDLAGNAAVDVQIQVTEGLSLLGESTKQDDTEDTQKVGAQKPLDERHRDEVLVTTEKSLFRRIFFSNFVDTYNQLFSSFLTAVVVITMSWNVFHGEMESSEFLGIFFVFKQLQKPATKISGVIKKAVSKTANLQRINEVLFDSPAERQDEMEN